MVVVGKELIEGRFVPANKAEGETWLRTAPDQEAGPASAKVFDALSAIPKKTFAEITLDDLEALLNAISWDTGYDAIDENLARELARCRSPNARPAGSRSFSRWCFRANSIRPTAISTSRSGRTRPTPAAAVP